MSDTPESTATVEETTEKPTASDVSPSIFGQTNTSTPIRLFGQFKANGFGFNNPSSASSFSHSTSSDQPTSGTYFTATLSKISASSPGGFGSSSIPLAASLASLGANKALFGGSSVTTPSSFTDLKSTSTKSFNENKRPISEISKDEDDEAQQNHHGDDEDDEEEEQAEEGNQSSLLKTVAEYEAKRATTHPTTTHIQGDTSTGEESETTKFQIAGKLFMYNGDQQQFVERGYGILKINETYDASNWDLLQARIIMRLDKSFRVILNSPIFSKMTVERVTDRSIRFGAQDESQLRVFIIKASTQDCTNLFRELQSRIQIIQRQQASKNNTPNKHNTSSSSDILVLDETSPPRTSATRKRSHSKSDSETSETSNDLSKKSKVTDGVAGVRKSGQQSTSEDDSILSDKVVEQETSTCSVEDKEKDS